MAVFPRLPFFLLQLVFSLPFPILREIPALLYTSTLKRVPLSGGALLRWTKIIGPFSLVNNQLSDIFTGNIIRINSEYGNNKRNKTSHRFGCFNAGSMGHQFTYLPSRIRKSNVRFCLTRVFLCEFHFVRWPNLIELFRSVELDSKFFFVSPISFDGRIQSSERVRLSSKTERSMW